MPVRIARPLPLLAWWIAATALPFAVVLPASLAIILPLAWGTLPGLQGYRYLRGAQLAEVQDILGHALPERIYAHSTTGRLSDTFYRYSLSPEAVARRSVTP